MLANFITIQWQINGRILGYPFLSFSLLVGKIMWVPPNCVFVYIYLYMYIYTPVYLFLYFFWQDMDEVINIWSSSSLENTPAKVEKKSKLVGFGE